MHRTILPALLASIALTGCQGTTGSSDPAVDGARLRPGLEAWHRPGTAKSPDAQAFLDQGMQWLYGFNDDEAIRCYHRAAALDPQCALAWWGIAYANGINVNDPVLSEREARDAWHAVQQAQARKEHATPVERALIDAIAVRYSKDPIPDVKPFEVAFAAAMERVWHQFPQDADVGTIYAESLMNLQPWDYWTRDGAPKGRATEIVATLERVLQIAPNHPGALHYYIHAVEASRQPDRAEAIADRLAKLVPGSGHLTHMPSHIYARLGRYSDAADANSRAVAAG